MHQTMEEELLPGGELRRGAQGTAEQPAPCGSSCLTREQPPEQLLEQGDALEPLLAEVQLGGLGNPGRCTFPFPKFDVVSETDPLDGLEAPWASPT